MRNSSLDPPGWGPCPQKANTCHARTACTLRRGERGTGCARGAVITSLSGMTQTSRPGPQMTSESTNLSTHHQRPFTCPLTFMSWGGGFWRVFAGVKGGTDAAPQHRASPRLTSSHGTSQQTGQTRSLALAPNTEKQQAREARDGQGHRAEGRGRPGQSSPRSKPLPRPRVARSKQAPERERRDGWYHDV